MIYCIIKVWQGGEAAPADREVFPMLGIYNYTVILTYLGMLSGFAGILFLLNGNVRGALICLMISGVCDMFDGKVASTKKDRTRSEKRFGIQIDSLSDLICFGVLPALIVYSVGRRTWLRAAACGAYHRFYLSSFDGICMDAIVDFG